jgi:hypothetical protein
MLNIKNMLYIKNYKFILKKTIYIPNMSKRYIESYAHRYAKTTLGSWLNKKMKQKWILENIDDIPNTADIYYEYPICKNNNNEIIGIKNNINNNNDIWLNYLEKLDIEKHSGSENNKVSPLSITPLKKPNYKNFNQLKLKPLCIFDIVCINNGKLHSVYEIKYKNPISKEKKEIIKELQSIENFKCYEISALTILDKVRPPKNIDYSIIN